MPELELQSSEAQHFLRLQLRRRQSARRRRFVEAGYFDSPERFCRDCINWPEGRSLIDYQGEAMERLNRNHRLAVRGPRGASKTAIAAFVILWFAITREMAAEYTGRRWKIATTAGSNRQLIEFLWPEIEKWAPRIKWDVVGRPPFSKDELLTKKLKLKHGHAFGASVKDKQMIEGCHEDEVLAVFDESKAIADDIFDAFEGAFSTGNAYALTLSTPGDPRGRFYDICRRAPGLTDWDQMHITLDQCVAAGQISQKFAEDRRNQWGEESRLYQAHILGEFSTKNTDALIPLIWIEQANERWYEWKKARELGPLTAVGSDVAGGGRDNAIVAPRYGSIVPDLILESADTMKLTGRIASMLQANPGAVGVVDVQSVGVGVRDRLRELELPFIAFNGGRSTRFRDLSGDLEFADTRSASWWNMRDLLDPANEFDVVLPVFEDAARRISLTGDLAAPRFTYTSTGKIKVESKNSGSEEEGGGLRKRLGRSTDAGDSVVMAFWPGEPEEEAGQWAVAGAGEVIQGED